ncbi:hypothetical protein GCM10020219_051520 [Nonomuraea dietziae]
MVVLPLARAIQPLTPEEERMAVTNRSRAEGSSAAPLVSSAMDTALPSGPCPR